MADILNDDNLSNRNLDITKGDDIHKMALTYKDSDADRELNMTHSDYNVAPVINGPAWKDLTKNTAWEQEMGYDNPVQRVGVEGIGDSYYDQWIQSEKDLEDINEVRAREQWLIPKLGSGLGRFTVETLNTGIGNIVGTAVGVYQGINNLADDDPNTTFWTGMWKNSITEIQDSIRKWADESMPIYTSKKEQEMGVLEHVLTSNFWANLMASAGFTSGMLLSTVLTGGMGAGSATAGILRAAGASEKAVNFGYRLVSGIMGSVSEASMEALNNYNDVKNNYSSELTNNYIRQKEDLNRRMEAEITSELIRANPSLLTENPIRIPEAEEKIKKMVKDKYANELNAVESKYKEDIQRVEDRSLSAGSMTFGLNMAILGLSNTMGTMSFLKAPSQNAERQIAKGLGQRFKEFIKGTAKDKPYGDGISATEAKLIGLREGLAEGFEESNQKWASNLAEKYYNSSYDPEATDKYSRFIETAMDTFKSTYTDPETWKEWISGALTGLLGTFNPAGIGKAISGQKTKLSDYWQGGVIEAWREGNALAERSQKAYDEMNKFATDKKLQDNARLGIFNIASKQRQMEAAARGDKFEYENENDAQTLKIAQTFANAGKLNEFEALIGNNENISDEELNALCEGLTRKDENGKYTSDYSFLLTDNGERISDILDNNDPRRKKAKEKIAKESKRIHDIIRNYQKRINEADAKTGYQRSPEELNFIAWGLTQVDCWEERLKSMYKRDEVQKVLDKIRNKLADDISNGESVQSVINKLSNRLNKQQGTEKINSDILEDLNKELSDLESQREYFEKYTKNGNERKRALTKSEKAKLDELDNQISSKKDEIRKAERRLRDNKNNLSKTSKELSDNKNISDKGNKSKEQLRELEEFEKNHTVDDLFTLLDELNAESSIMQMAGKPTAFKSLINLINSSEIENDEKSKAVNTIKDMIKCCNASNNVNNYINKLINNPDEIQNVINDANNAHNKQVEEQVKTEVEQFADSLQNETPENVDIVNQEGINVDSVNFRILNSEEQKNSFNEMLEKATKRLEANLIFSGWSKEKRDNYINKTINNIIENIGRNNKTFKAFSEAYKLNSLLSKVLEDVVGEVENSGTFNESEARDITQKIFETLNVYAYNNGVHPIFLNHTDMLNVLEHIGYNLDSYEVRAAVIFCDKIYKRLRKYLKDIKSNGHIKLQQKDGKIVISDTKNNSSYFVEDSEFNDDNNNTKQNIDSTTENKKNKEIDEFYEKLEEEVFESLEDRVASESLEWGIEAFGQQQGTENPVNAQIVESKDFDLDSLDFENNYIVIHQTDETAANVILSEGLKTIGGLNGTSLFADKDSLLSVIEKQRQGHGHRNTNHIVVMSFPKKDFYKAKIQLDDISTKLIEMGETNDFTVPRKFIKVVLHTPEEANSDNSSEQLPPPQPVINLSQNNGEIEYEERMNAMIFDSMEFNPKDLESKNPVNEFAQKKMVDEGGYEFVESGKLYSLIKKNKKAGKNVPLYAKRDSRINGVIFLYVNNKGKYQLVGFVQNDVQTNPMKSYLFGSETAGNSIKSPKEGYYFSEENKYVNNIEPSVTYDSIPVENGLNTVDPVPIYNKNNEPLCALMFEDSKNSFKYNDHSNLLSEKLWGNKPISQALKDGDVLIAFNGKVLNGEISKEEAKDAHLKPYGFQVITKSGTNKYVALDTSCLSYMDFVKSLNNNDSVMNRVKENTMELALCIHIFFTGEMKQEDLEKAFAIYSKSMFRVQGTKDKFVDSSNKEVKKYQIEKVNDDVYLKIVIPDKNNYATDILKIKINQYKNSNIEEDLVNYYTHLIYDAFIKANTHENPNQSITNTRLEFTFDSTCETYNPEDMIKYRQSKLYNLLLPNVPVVGSFVSDKNNTTLSIAEYTGKSKNNETSKNDNNTNDTTDSVTNDTVNTTTNNTVNDTTVSDTVNDTTVDSKTNNTTNDVANNNENPIVNEGESSDTTTENPEPTNPAFGALDKEDDDNDLPFRENTSNSGYSKELNIRQGLYAGYMFAREFFNNVADRLGNTDRRLIDFVLNNLNKKLIIKVLNTEQWSNFSKERKIPEGVLGMYSLTSTKKDSDIIILKEGTDITTILHELAHAATVKMLKDAIENNKNTKQLEDLKSILLELKSMNRENPTLFSNIEGANNFLNQTNIVTALKELVAECIANKDLQALLKTIKTQRINENKSKNIFRRFIDWVNNFLKNLKIDKAIIDKINEYTLFNKFENSVINLKNDEEKTEIKSTNNKINGSYRAYQMNVVDKDTNIIQYSTNNVDNIDYEVVNTDGFLNKYKKDGSWSDEYTYLNKAFSIQTGKTFDINDKTEYGKKTSREFYEFLISKGYKGIDMTTNNKTKDNLSQNNNAYLVAFGKDYKTKDEIATENNVNLDNASEESINYFRRCI